MLWQRTIQQHTMILRELHLDMYDCLIGIKTGVKKFCGDVFIKFQDDLGNSKYYQMCKKYSIVKCRQPWNCGRILDNLEINLQIRATVLKHYKKRMVLSKFHNDFANFYITVGAVGNDLWATTELNVIVVLACLGTCATKVVPCCL